MENILSLIQNNMGWICQILTPLTFLCALISLIFSFYQSRHSVTMLWYGSFSDHAPVCGIRVCLFNDSNTFLKLLSVEILDSSGNVINDLDYSPDMLTATRWDSDDDPYLPFGLASGQSIQKVYYLKSYPSDVFVKITSDKRIHLCRRYLTFPAKIDQIDQMNCDDAKRSELDDDRPKRQSNRHDITPFLKKHSRDT